MTIHLGYVATGATIYIPFHTFNSSGASVTISGLAVTDIEIYKNGSVTQRSSDAGYTLLDTDGIDFDGLTGIHGFSIDLNDNTDAGFYAAGSFYWVVVSAITVDSQTVSFVAATFFLGPVQANVTQNAGTAITSSSGRQEVNLSHVAGTSIATLTGAYPALGISESGTMQAGSTSTTAVLRAATAFADDNPIGWQIWIYGGTGIGQTRFITDWVSATDTATVATWTTTPDNTSTYIVLPTAPASAAGSAPTAAEVADAVWDEATAGHTTSGTFGEQLKTDVDAILVDTGTTLDGRIPAALVSGRMDASVGAMAANVMTAAAAAADLTTELQSGLATSSAVATLQTSVDTIDDFLDTEVAAIVTALTANRGEPGQGSPAVSTSVLAKIDYLYKAWRNRSTQTASEYALYADDGTTKDHEAACSDDATTFVRGEITTGA
jgi:hypothetical protein